MSACIIVFPILLIFRGGVAMRTNVDLSIGRSEQALEGVRTHESESSSTSALKAWQPARDRPTKETTKVEFGILLKEFDGINFVGEAFTVDVVVATKWLDPRNTALVPSDKTFARYDSTTADAQMWLPRVGATNIDHQGSDVISSSIHVAKNGTTTEVKRTLLTLKTKYDTGDFPFDSQHLRIWIASEIYMAEEVSLVPTSNFSLWGAPASLFTSWRFINASLSASLDTDGILHKSRGMLQIDVQRPLYHCQSTVFLPSFMLLIITWSALWLPLEAQFTMPRIALCSLSLLSQILLAQMVEGYSQAGEVTWLDRYMEKCFWLQFLQLMLNGIALAVKHRIEDAIFAETLDREMIVFFPITTAFVMACLCCGQQSLAQILLMLFPLVYFISIGWRFKMKQLEGDDGKGRST